MLLDVVSALLASIPCVWSWLLFRRLREWPLAVLSLLFGLLAVFPLLRIGFPGSPAALHTLELPRFLASLGVLVALFLLSRAVTERQRSAAALEQREQRWRPLFDQMISGFAVHEILCDTTGRPYDYRFLEVNPAFEKLTGLRGSQIRGKTVREVLPGMESYWIDSYGKVALTGETIRFTNYARPLQRWYDVAAYRVGPGQFACIFNDVTAQKELEQSLRASEARYRLLAEHASDVIWTMDLDLNMTYVSPSHEKLSGYSAEETMGLSLEQTLTPASYALARRVLEEELAREQQGDAQPNRSRMLELEQRRKDGALCWVEEHVRFLRDENQKPIGLLGVTRDITQRKQALAEKKKLESQLRQAQQLEAIGFLASGIAHDFNNILGSVLGYAELLEDEIPPGATARSPLREIVTAGERGRELVRRILTFSRPAEPQHRPTDLAAIIEEALELLRPTIPATAQVRQKIDPTCGPVMADPTQLHQVIMNLCINASQSIGPAPGTLEVGLAPVEVDAGLAREHAGLQEGSYIRLTVRDTGPGIDPAAQEHIFDPFFTTKSAGRGTGLGLSAVHRIVASHGGAIQVESAPGKGANFYVYLPCFQGKLAEKIKVVEAVPRGEEHILLVDDEESLVRLGREMLEGLGYRVTARTRSAAALDRFRQDPNSIDLVIADLVMPQMTGRELIAKLRQLRPNVPILLTTGEGNSITSAEAKSLRVEIIAKPFSLRDLAEGIRRVIGEAKGKEARHVARFGAG